MKCERCGATLAGDRTAVAPGEPIPAACPRCLLGIGLASDPEELSAEAGGPLEATEAVGDRIGPYRILGCLGEGGMGVVYLAEQSEPIRRRVALKLIKLGMDTRDVIARFETERQVLALMNHPHIARVYDAGVAPDGRPYFVMDPVPGEAITEFCDRRELTLRQRIDLFLQACDAIQHAHEKGIIHRDIKPSNVLVSEPDGRARVTVIDFGIAKAIQPHLTERTLLTRQGLFLGTPEYMSPEQAASEGRDVDTRTDVYALGMLLYELLVGRLPLDFRQDRDRGMDEIRRSRSWRKSRGRLPTSSS